MHPPSSPHYTIPGLTMNVVLAAAQTVAGTQYRTLLKNAGLERWADSLPPPTMEPIATEAELAHLFGTVYQMLGEAGTRLMMRNWGTTLAPMIGEIPMIQQVAAEIQALPAAEQLPRSITRLQEITNMFWSPSTVQEDARGWHLTLDRCPVCPEIRGAHAPICANLVAIYPRLLQTFTGHRLAVAESACRAAGDAHCVYTISK